MTRLGATLTRCGLLFFVDWKWKSNRCQFDREIQLLPSKLGISLTILRPSV